MDPDHDSLAQGSFRDVWSSGWRLPLSEGRPYVGLFYRALPPRVGFRQSARQDFKESKPQIQGIKAYNSASDSFEIKLTI